MFKYIFKLIIIGNNNVGKSSIVKALNGDYFNHQYHSTIGIDFASKILTLSDDTPVKLQMWDTAGTERFRCIVQNYYRDCIGGIIVFDITSSRSFGNVKSWYDDLLNHTNKNPGELTIVLVGNKNDLDNRVVSEAEAKSLASELGISYIETSAKLNTNIINLFHLVSNNIYNKIINNEVEVDESIMIDKFKIAESISTSRFRKFASCCVIS